MAGDDSMASAIEGRKELRGRPVVPASRKIASRLSARSRIVVPKPIREFLGIGPGDVIAFEEQGGEIVIRPARSDPFLAFDEWDGGADEEAYADLVPPSYRS